MWCVAYLAHNRIRGASNTDISLSDLVHSWLVDVNKFHIISIAFFPSADSLQLNKLESLQLYDEIINNEQRLIYIKVCRRN